MITKYLLNRTNLMCLFVLIDIRHNPQPMDQEFMQWLSEKEIPFVLTFTKVDKLGKNLLQKNIELYKLKMLSEWEELPEIFITSAQNKMGVEDISKYIIHLK